ncbi:MAG: hypothetical protein IEMM0008_1297 [bacterium]|nr:MAG: hypothetical protein IEMM0008_1297 [bacterium]
MFSEDIFIYSKDREFRIDNPILYLEDKRSRSGKNYRLFLHLVLPFRFMSLDSLDQKSITSLPSLNIELKYYWLAWIRLYGGYGFSFNPLRELDSITLSGENVKSAYKIDNNAYFGVDLLDHNRLGAKIEFQWLHSIISIEKSQRESAVIHAPSLYLSLYYKLEYDLYFNFQYQSPSFMKGNKTLGQDQIIIERPGSFAFTFAYYERDFYHSQFLFSYKRTFYSTFNLIPGNNFHLEIEHFLPVTSQGITLGYGGDVIASPFTSEGLRIPLILTLTSRISSITLSVEYRHFIRNFSDVYIPPGDNLLKERDLIVIRVKYFL